MLLAIDIGNTNTVAGIFDGDRLVDLFRATSNKTLTVDECGFFVTGLLEKFGFDSKQIDRIVIASVVPSLNSVYRQMCDKYFRIRVLFVSSDIKLPIKIGYDDPSEVGADRIANAVAAYDKYKTALIVVDFGTATTFDVINSDGVYLGGVIAPGPETSGMDLARRASRLFEVGIEDPGKIIGKNTSDSIKAGLFFGTVGQVDKIIELIIGDLGENPKVISTGGLAGQFMGYSKYIEDSDKSLTLIGLKKIADFQN